MIDETSRENDAQAPPLESDADALFGQYLVAKDHGISELLLAELLTAHAEPLVLKIARRKLFTADSREGQDVEDLCSDVVTELFSRLRELRADASAEAIERFYSYTATAAYRACNDYVRRKYPQRHRLKTRIRYLLTTDPRFALWESVYPGWICGKAVWQRKNLRCPEWSFEEWRKHILDHLPRKAPSMHLQDLVAAIFDQVRTPVELDTMVSLVSEISGIRDPVEVPLDSCISASADSGVRAAIRLEQKQCLTRLWLEIGELPPSQRVALLLNLRSESSGSALALFPPSGVATLRDIAGVLGMAAEEFADLWNRLPLDDLTIGERLGVTRQQVINLRKSARERLARKVQAFGGAW